MLFSSNILILGSGNFAQEISLNYLSNIDRSSFIYHGKKLRVNEKNLSYYKSHDFLINGEKSINPNSKNDYYIVGVGFPHKKKIIEDKFLESYVSIKKIDLLNINSDIHKSAQIGHGTIALNSIISYDTCLSNNVLISAWCIISNNVFIGTNSTVFARTTILPNAVIGHNTFIGSNSFINHGVRIGSNCSISPGSTIYEDVPDNVIYISGKIISKI